MRSAAAATLGVCVLLNGAALAQVTSAPAGKPVAVKAKAAPAPSAPAATASPGMTTVAPAKRPIARECTRLPLSDIQFGREYTIKVARDKLEDYAKKVAKDKGWKNGYTRSAETASCEDYLWLPVGGQEYKCLVTATFCRK